MSLALYTKSHRWIGFGVAIIVVLIAVTGMALNHSGALNLGSRAMPDWIAQWVYGKPAAPRKEIVVEDKRYSVSKSGVLLVDGERLANCAALAGIIERAGVLVAVCSGKLVLLSPQGELVEEYYFEQAKAREIQRVYSVRHSESVLFIENHDGSVSSLDLNSMRLSNVSNRTGTLENSSGFVQSVSLTNAAAEEFSLERLMLDLHAGRVLGGWGVWLVDLTALSLIWLSISGYLSWRARQKLLEE